MSNTQLITKRTAFATLQNQVRVEYAALEALGEKATGEQRTALNARVDELKIKRAELDGLETIYGEVATEERKAAEPAPSHKTPGEIFIGSEQFKNNDGRSVRSVKVGEAKNLMTGAVAAQGGAWVRTDRVEPIALPRLGLQILNLINVSSTSSNSVEYVEHATRVNNAANVAEASTVAGATSKPESDLTFALRTTPVRTIATYIPQTRQILEDSAQLQALIDNELPYLLNQRLAAQIINGDGIAPNFTGFLNTAGVQQRTMSATTPVGRGQLAADTHLDTFRRAITDLALDGYVASAILVNPAIGEAMELTKDSQARYVSLYDPVSYRVWRTPVVESVDIAANRAIVSDFRAAATLWTHRDIEVRFGEPNDMFLKNLMAILAEMQAAFAVQRPRAVERIILP